MSEENVVPTEWVKKKFTADEAKRVVDMARKNSSYYLINAGKDAGVPYATAAFRRAKIGKRPDDLEDLTKAELKVITKMYKERYNLK